MENIGIYKITNKTNKKVYIGSSMNIKARISKHKSQLRNKKHRNGHLQNSWNKHGEDSFNFEIIETVKTFELLLEREQFYLDNTKNKYNILSKAYASYGYKHSEETKKLLSELGKKRTGDKNPFYGKIPSEESINMIRNIGKSQIGDKNPFYGKIHTEKSKEKMSQSLKGMKMPESFLKKQKGNTRGAKEFSVTTPKGDVFTIINLTKFCKENNLKPQNARAAIAADRKYKEYYFKRV